MLEAPYTRRLADILRVCKRQGVVFVVTQFSKEAAWQRYGIPDDDYGLARYFYNRCVYEGFDICILAARDENVLSYAKLLFFVLGSQPEAVVTLMHVEKFLVSWDEVYTLTRSLASLLGCRIS